MEPGSSSMSKFDKTWELRSRLDLTIATLEQLGYRVESALASKPRASILVLALGFLVCTSVRAFCRPFWFDEILTRYIAILPTPGAIYRALAAHTESSPLLFHLISRLSGITLGWNELGLRFPGIAGYLAMILGIYFIVRQRAGPLYATIGALSNYLTDAPYYSTEARPYGLLLGLSCTALACWQLAARHRRRWLALAGLWLSLATALGVHYYAVLSFAAIGLGELVRTWRTRQIDWPVWGALGFATAPVPFLLPLARTNLALRAGYYSPATLRRLLEGVSEFYFPLGGIIFAAFAVMVGACVFALSGRNVHAIPPRLETPPAYEVAAWVALLLAPLEAFILGRFVTGVFVQRYAIVTIIGFSILLPLCLRRLFRNSRGAGLAALIFVGLCFGRWFSFGSKIRMNDFNTRSALFLRTLAHSPLPIVVASPRRYLELAYYADKDLGDALVYIPDPQEALRYTGQNTADYNLTGLHGIAPLDLPTYSSFVRSHPRFFVLWEASSEGSSNSWIVYRLRDAGAELRLCKVSWPQVLFLVDFPGTATSTGDRGPNVKADVPCKENGSQ